MADKDTASWLSGFLSGYQQGYGYGRIETDVLAAHEFDPNVDVDGGGTGGGAEGAPARDLPNRPSGCSPLGTPDGSSRASAPSQVPVVVPPDVEMSLLQRGMLAALSGMVEMFRIHDMPEAMAVTETAYRFQTDIEQRRRNES